MSNSAFRTFSMRRPSIHIRPLPSSEAQRWTCLGVYVIDFAFRLVTLSPLCVHLLFLVGKQHCACRHFGG